jgi:hypothetical protein
MADFMTMVAQYLGLIYAFLALGLALAIYFAFQFQIKFWWTNFWYSIPFVGKLARLSRDTTRSSNPGWLLAEETLCGDYRKHVLTTSEVEFRKRLSYMGKAQDLGRHPLPGWMIAILATLLVAEGLGFSYLLGTWMAREGSANVHAVLMLAIVFVICVIMLFLTHAAGYQLYRTGLVKRCDKEWRDHDQEGPLKSAEVKLDDDQSIDDHVKPFTQTVNRVGETGGYWMVVAAVVAISAIATISTVMRIKHLNQEIIEETTEQNGGGAAEGNPFASGDVPPELAVPQKEADTKARVEMLSNIKSEGLAAFTMLAIIFVVTQIVSIYAGHKYGFAGKQSKEAYKGTRGFATYDDYMSQVDPIFHVAQAKLRTLQRNLATLGGNVKLNLTKTFDDYIREDDMRRSARRYGNTAIGSPSINPAVSSTIIPQSRRAPDVDEVLQKLRHLETPEQKKALVASLTPQLRAEVVELLKAEKASEAEAEKKAQDAELDTLF